MGFGLFRIGGPIFLLWALCVMGWAFWEVEPVIVVAEMVRPMMGKANGTYFKSLDLGFWPMIWDCKLILIRAICVCSM